MFEEFGQWVQSNMFFLDYAPVIFTSALDGFQLDRLLEAIRYVSGQLNRTLPTSLLNRALQEAIERAHTKDKTVLILDNTGGDGTAAAERKAQRVVFEKLMALVHAPQVRKKLRGVFEECDNNHAEGRGDEGQFLEAIACCSSSVYSSRSSRRPRV